ncbi:10764_t:CDS:2, partial [Cetraspora pellucida]
KTFQMNLDLENMNNNLSQENFTPVFDDDDDSLSIVDLYLDNQSVTETSARDIAETSARELYILSEPILAGLQTRSLLFAIYVTPEDYDRLQSTLGMQNVEPYVPLYERHTGIFIAENIIEQVEYFGLSKQLLSLTMNNAANMDACGHYLATLLESCYNNTNFCRIRYASYILNLTIKEGISVLDKSVKKACEFTSHIHCSQPSFEELKRLIMKLLKPIYEATKLLSSSSHPTLGDLRMIFYVIIEVLNNSQIEEDTIKGQIAKKISRKIDYYWNELQTYFHEAVLLDPLTKFTTFEHTEENTISQAETQTETTSARDYFRRQIKQIHHSSFTLHNDILDEYFNALDEDMKSSYSRWMPLARMARNYLIIQATSVTSEQIFSIAKHTISKTRNRIDAEKACASLCLKT